MDEDTSAYEKNHIRNAIRIDWTKDLQDPVRRDFIDQAGFEKLLSEKGIANDDHRRPLRRQQQLVRVVRLLVLQALRPRGRQPARRRPQEVGAGLPRPGRRRSRPAPRPRTRPSRRTSRSAPTATTWWPRSARRTWSTCARPTSSAASCSPRRTSRRSSRSAPATCPTARNIPWSKNANDDGTFKSDEELKALYEDEQVDLAKDTIAYCRIGERSALTWFVLHELLGQENVKNYDGSWTEYGSLVGVPIELGASK